MSRTRKIKSLYYLCLIHLIVAPSVYAGEQEIEIDESLEELKSLSIEELLDVPIVYGVSGHSQKITEAPSSISIVTRDDIRKHGYRTLADLLRSVQGFYINYDRQYGNIGVRGVNRPGDFGGRVIVLVDGHRINDPLYDSAPIVNDFIIDVDLIERVEIIRGPSFSLYGANAFFGGVNVITRKGRDVDGVEAAFKAASFDTYQGRLTFGKQFENGLEMLLSGSYLNSGGQSELFYEEYNDPRTNNGIAENLDGSTIPRLFGSLSYGDFTLRGGYSIRDKNVPTAPFGARFNTLGTNLIDERYYAELSYAHKYDNGLDLFSKVYYDRYNFNGDYAFPFAYDPNNKGRTINRNPAVAEWWGSEVRLSKEIFAKNRLMAGVEYRDTFHSEQQSFDINPAATYADTQTDWNSWSAYLQDEYAIFSNFIINAGVRYDYYSFFGDTLNPKVALIYNPFRKTTLKFLYGDAFRAPNDYERTFQNNVQKTNPDLQPETIKTFELIWDQYITNNLRFNIAGYHNQIQGLSLQVQDPIDKKFFYANAGNVNTWGTDFEIEAKTDSGWKGRVSYSWQKSTDQATGDLLSNSPAHLMKFNLIAPLYDDKVYAGLEVQYTSGVTNVRGKEIDGYWISNLNLYSQQLLPDFDFSVGIFNLFDQKYFFPARAENIQNGIQQDGRTFQIMLQYHY